MSKLKTLSKKSTKINPRQIQKSYLDQMEDSLQEKGVIFFEPSTNLNIDEECLHLPAEITEVSSKALGEYLNALTQQKMYLRTLLGRVELLVEESRRKYVEASEPFYKKYSLDKMSETAKDKLINSQETVKEFYYDYMDNKRKQNLVGYSIDNIVDAIFMISREVTRRSGDLFDENRNHNVGRR